MSKLNSFSTLNERILFWSSTTLIVLIVGWSVWVTNRLNEIVTEDRVRYIVSTEAPYVQDRKLISSQLGEVSEIKDSLSTVIEQNTAAINSLRVEIAKMQVRSSN